MCTLKWSIFFTCLTICLITPAVGIGQTVSTSSENQSSISGRVTVDGKARAGVVVELREINYRSPVLEAVRKATTSKTGRYLIRNIAPGTYKVLPVASGAIIPYDGDDGRPGKRLTLNAGEAIRDFDFHLTSEGRITGRVSSADGNPVAGESVTLKIATSGQYKQAYFSPQLSGLITNERGEFSISGVPPGKYLVAVGVSYGLASTSEQDVDRNYYQQTFYPDTTDESSATVVVVNPGRETNDINITVGTPLKTYEISGQVVDSATGLGIPGVRLGVQSKTGNGKFISDGVGPWSSKSDGQFHIKGAPTGEYSIYPVNDRASNSYGDAIKFNVEEGDVAGLKIVMRRASNISGSVIVDGSNSINPGSEQLRLAVQRLNAGRNDSVGQTAVISADGTFRLSGIPPGKIGFSIVSQSTTGFRSLNILRIERNGTVLPGGVEVNPEEDVTGVTIVVGTGNSVLRGQVVIEGGPLEGLIMYVGYRATNQAPNRWFTANLEAKGRFVIDKLMPGEYELQIGPMHTLVDSDAGSRTMSRMPTVKQIVNVPPESDTEVTLVMTLRPK